MKSKTTKPPRIAEKVEQAHIVQLAVTVGAFVIVLGTVRRGSKCPKCGEWVRGHMGTQQTPGVADLEIWLPERRADTGRRRELVKWETKASDGRLEPAQADYRDACVAGGVTWGSGTYAQFEAFMVVRGFVKAENVPHYRQPEARP